jgi:glycosyltransferase involved in cell wall biosynthesis
VPTIATDTTAIRTYFDEEMLYLVPVDNVSALAEAAIEVLSDAGQLRRLSRNIRQFNQAHNWHIEAEAYVNLVEGFAGEV